MKLRFEASSVLPVLSRLRSVGARVLSVLKETPDSGFFLFWVLFFLKVVDKLSVELSLLYWVFARVAFVRGGLWTLWILFSCGVGAFLSVTVAEFCGGSGNLFCCYRR